MTKEYIQYMYYLEALRKSGVTNMFGATPYLMEKFDLEEKEAKNILLFWIENYDRLAEEFNWNKKK